MEEALEVVCQRHQRPFRADILKAAQAEASEAERLFDDADYRLNGLLAQGVKLPSLLCLKTILHPFLRAGLGSEWRGLIRNFVCGSGLIFLNQRADSEKNLDPNWMANCVTADRHVRGGFFHLRTMFCKAR